MIRHEAIRQLLMERGGRAGLADLYAESLDATVRQISGALERLVARGEARLEDGAVILTAQPAPGSAPARLWRGAHQLSQGARRFKAKDLAQVAEVTHRNVKEWLGVMHKGGHLERTSRGAYKVAKGAPHRNQPPAFRWARRGKAKSNMDKRLGKK